VFPFLKLLLKGERRSFKNGNTIGEIFKMERR
jgi:hypothetical protein